MTSKIQLKEDKSYRVEKYNTKTEEIVNYGRMCAEDVKVVVKGYAIDQEFSDEDMINFTRKNSAIMFTAYEI